MNQTRPTELDRGNNDRWDRCSEAPGTSNVPPYDPLTLTGGDYASGALFVGAALLIAGLIALAFAGWMRRTSVVLPTRVGARHRRR